MSLRTAILVVSVLTDKLDYLLASGIPLKL
jgi:hypothetical protein